MEKLKDWFGVLPYVLSLAVFYGAISTRVDAIEKENIANKDIKERLVRLETKLDYLIKTQK